MSKYLFQAEAVNFDSTVYDTSDISTIRGGGFYLLNRINKLSQDPEYKGCVVTEGASKVVIKLDVGNGKPEDTRKEILEKLYDKDNRIDEIMFLVDYVDDTGDIQHDVTKLMGKIRVQQMQSPTVRIFENTLSGEAKNKKGELVRTFDGFNHVLPAHGEQKDKYVSNFTENRMKTGRKLRKDIYDEILSDKNLFKGKDFTDSLEELSEDRKQGNLNHKIAYIYIDGNKFGKLVKQFNKEEQFKAFDEKFKAFKKQLVKSLFELAKEYKSFMNQDKIRLETLLWGGDEIIVVVPAWMGWTVMKTFYQTVNTFDDKGLTLDMDNRTLDLTFAMGVVFTHHKNPVRNLYNISKELVETVKANLKKNERYDREKGNRCICAVLESLEIPPKKYDLFAGDIYNTHPKNTAFSLKEMTDLQDMAAWMEKGFSRGKLYELAKAWKASGTEPESEAVKTVVERGLETSTLGKTDKKCLLTCMENVTGFNPDLKNGFPEDGNHGYRFLQLSELYDYLIANSGDREGEHR